MDEKRLARIGNIVEEVMEWPEEDIAYLVSDLEDILNK
jgi:hypothetical protein